MRCRKPVLPPLILMLGAIALPAGAQSDADVAKSFRAYIADYVASYKTDRREQVVQTSGGWSRQYFEVGSEYGIDVRKTDSLISPYVGVAEFALTMHYTAFHKTQAEAEADHRFVQSMSMEHRHTYAYQDGAWALKSREEYSSAAGKWWDCDRDGCAGEGAK
jgi:hypothetical protein